MTSPFWVIVASNAALAGALALAAGLVGRFWKNAAAVHLLWLAVLLKLFTPPLVTLAIPAWFERPASIGEPAESTPRGGAHATARFESTETVPRPAAEPRQAPPEQARPPAAVGPVPARGRPSMATLLAAIWLVGSAVLAIGYAVRIAGFARAIRGFQGPSDDLRRLVAELSARVGLRRPPRVRTTDLTVPPLVWSMGGPPLLILPARLFERLGSEGWSAIVLHELAHIRRRDHLVRLLELASRVVFWWHPAVWWASRNLRDLEEVCCDGRVVEASPRQARSYALALLTTFEFLSGSPRRSVPLPTAVRHSSNLSRRVHMLAHPRVVRLKLGAALVVAGLVSPPLVLAIGGPSAPQQAKQAPAIVGSVSDPEGAPLADALVRVVIPEMDLRLASPPADARVYEVRTDAEGAYRLELPGIDAPTTASIEVLKPGFLRSSGPPMGWVMDDRRLQITPGAEAAASFELTPSRYFKGVAVDDEGEPVAGASVQAYLHDDRSSGWAESTRTAEDGSFELFNYAEKFTAAEHHVGPARARVLLSREDHVAGTIGDLLALPEGDRESIRVVLPKGAVLAGTVLDAAGEPAPGVTIKANSDGNEMKATTTDALGAFRLQGIEKAPVTLSVISAELGQKGTAEIQVEGDLDGLSLRLRAMDLPDAPATYDVLGLELADLDPKYQDAFELFNAKGALIVDPGADPDRLGIGTLARGYVFWLVGEERVGNVREFVERVIAEAEAQPVAPAPVRVVYEFHSKDGDGTNTQYLSLMPEDIDLLKQTLARFD